MVSNETWEVQGVGSMVPAAGGVFRAVCAVVAGEGYLVNWTLESLLIPVLLRGVDFVSNGSQCVIKCSPSHERGTNPELYTLNSQDEDIPAPPVRHAVDHGLQVQPQRSRRAAPAAAALPPHSPRAPPEARSGNAHPGRSIREVGVPGA